MAIKKSELYSKLWKSCDELRGGMDASQYKDYILVLLFMRYVTDKYHGKQKALIDVPDGGSFHDLVKLKGDKEIGDKTNKVIRKMADANDLVGVITVADFNDADKLGKGKEMVDRLTKLVAIFEDEEFNFGGNGADGDDILGDAYEYLMRHFATQSGKSKGQFYTPAEVSRIMAQVIGINKITSQDQTIYDPTCGSGSLLLKAADQAARGVTIYGQEKDVATVALAKMNMILHGNEIAEIQQGDTLASPEFQQEDGSLKTFDFAVANPPFSTKSWSNGFDAANDLYDRFTGFGLPPAKNGDYAFLLHLIKSLKSYGKGAIILPHGVLFRGNVEAEIRQNIIRRGYIKGIIGLPANLFYGTGIPAAIIIIDKENAGGRRGIFIIDASKGYMKDGNKNRLREQDVHKAVDAFNKLLEIPKYSRMVSYEEIEKNEYNLNIPRYIDNQEPEDLQDISAHLLGGIPNRDIDDLDKYWQVTPGLRGALFENNGRDGYSELKVSIDDIRDTIFNHQEFMVYADEISGLINGWSEKYIPLFESINEETDPKAMIYEIAEDLLITFEGRILIDKYDIYQILMDYWLETMKDDVYLVVENGWVASSVLVPPPLVIARYFASEQAEIAELEIKRDEITQEKEAFEEEYSGETTDEERPSLDDASNDKGKITKASIKERLIKIKDEPESSKEEEMLLEYLELMDKESAATKAVKDAVKALDKKVADQYRIMTPAEVRNIVVHDKWISCITTEVNGELDRVAHRLAARIRELAERYEMTLPVLEQEVEILSAKVEEHLKRMGFKW